MSSVGKSIEWLAFLEKASEFAASSPAKAVTLALTDPEQWAASPASANLRQQETHEALQLLPKSDLWSSLQELESIEPSLERLARSAVLDLGEWSMVRRWLRAFHAFRSCELPENLPQALPQFSGLIESLPDPSAALRKLERLITPDGELSDSASPELARISAELRSIKRDITSRLETLAHEYNQKGVLQGNYTDLRDGRYVLPVRLSSQHEVPGLHHEASASKQTVFIEPKEVTELNNRLRQRQNDWLQEVHRILTTLSAELAPQAGPWAQGMELLIHWDAVHARARAASRYDGLPVECGGGQELELSGTAHPLLWWSMAAGKVQRNSIHMDASQRALLITGPNTGGKTVLLKTIGLAAIFARTGFFMPLDRPGKVPYFADVFSDLGDSQSIESQLSSFSSHLASFREILARAGANSLVLLDELNSATDPEEGAALSRAFLENLLDRGAWLVTTTHDPVLKSLGQQDNRILTAAMAFDEASRAPTYRLQLGIPGRSRALETAERLGIPASVLERARSLLSTQHKEWETWVGELETQVLDARLAREQAETLRAELEKKNAALDDKIRELQDELKLRARQKIRQLLEQAQDGVRQRLSQLENETSRKRIESARSDLVRETEGRLEAVDQAFDSELARAGVDPARARAPQPRSPSQAPSGDDHPKAGETVRIPKWKNTGVVMDFKAGSQPGSGQVRVAMGTLQMTLPLNEIERISGGMNRKPQVTLKWESALGAGEGPRSSRLDLRGMRLDEALAAAERYLEQIFSTQRFTQVTLVHGLGTGALREGIRKRLSSLPFVSDFRDGGPGGGGAGATVVDLTPQR